MSVNIIPSSLFVQTLDKNSIIKELDLSRNKLFSADLIGIAPFLKKLEKLNLSHNLIDRYFVVDFARSFDNKTLLNFINLENNRLGNLGCITLAHYLE